MSTPPTIPPLSPADLLEMIHRNRRIYDSDFRRAVPFWIGMCRDYGDDIVPAELINDYRAIINSMVAGQHTFSREPDSISALAHNHAAIFALRSFK